MRYLYVFGYCTPAQYADADGDHEDSCACFIEAATEAQAFERGRELSERFVAHIFSSCESAGQHPSWLADNFAHWIEHAPQQRFSTQALAELPVVTDNTEPNFSDWMLPGVGQRGGYR